MIGIYAIFVLMLLLIAISVILGYVSIAVILGYVALVVLIPILYNKRSKITIAHRIFSNIVITYSLFAITGISLGVIDALIIDWKAKAFIWLALITILMVYLTIATIPLYLVISGIIGMYGGFWSITWAIIWKMMGRKIDYNIWVLPNVWLPEIIYWPIVFSSIIIYVVAIIYSYKKAKQ